MRLRIPNPFPFGRPILDLTDFVGHRDIIRDISDALLIL